MCSFICRLSRTGARLMQVEAAISRLMRRHGGGILYEKTFDLRLRDKSPYPDGKYLIKGADPKIWKQFRLRKERGRFQGTIRGKRCGTTENIGLAKRLHWRRERGGACRYHHLRY